MEAWVRIKCDSRPVRENNGCVQMAASPPEPRRSISSIVDRQQLPLSRVCFRSHPPCRSDTNRLGSQVAISRGGGAKGRRLLSSVCSRGTYIQPPARLCSPPRPAEERGWVVWWRRLTRWHVQTHHTYTPTTQSNSTGILFAQQDTSSGLSLPTLRKLILHALTN